MSYKSEKIIIAKTKYDKRIKLTDEDKLVIKRLHSKGFAIRALARLYSVDRRSIQYLVRPGLLEHHKELRKLRGGSKIYYDKERHRKYIMKHRRYKQSLYIAGKIGINRDCLNEGDLI